MVKGFKQDSVIDAQLLYIKIDKVIEHTLDGELVMAHFVTDRYYGLNQVGTRIWHLLATPQSLGQLCAQLCHEFDVDAAQCGEEVRSFMQSLLTAQLIRKVQA